MNTYDTARYWVDKGYSVIPITYRSKRPAFDALRITRSMEGQEISWSVFKGRQATDRELRMWFTGPKRNIGIVTGFTGLVVIDFDTLSFYEAWCEWAAGVGGKALECANHSFKVISNRGVHVYVTCDEAVESFAIEHAVDIKARWGYVLAPPSVHPSGHEYVGGGGRIVHCERLADVFPFSKPEYIAASQPMPITDPWEAADSAIVCGGGAVDRVKSQVTVFDVLGVSLYGHKSILVRCPLHDDKNPSMLVYADGHCRCLAGCADGRQMDVIDLVAAMNNITNREAIALLSQ